MDGIDRVITEGERVNDLMQLILEQNSQLDQLRAQHRAEMAEIRAMLPRQGGQRSRSASAAPSRDSDATYSAASESSSDEEYIPDRQARQARQARQDRRARQDRDQRGRPTVRTPTPRKRAAPVTPPSARASERPAVRQCTTPARTPRKPMNVSHYDSNQRLNLRPAPVQVSCAPAPRAPVTLSAAQITQIDRVMALPTSRNAAQTVGSRCTFMHGKTAATPGSLPQITAAGGFSVLWAPPQSGKSAAVIPIAETSASIGRTCFFFTDLSVASAKEVRDKIVGIAPSRGDEEEAGEQYAAALNANADGSDVTFISMHGDKDLWVRLRKEPDLLERLGRTTLILPCTLESIRQSHQLILDYNLEGVVVAIDEYDKFFHGFSSNNGKRVDAMRELLSPKDFEGPRGVLAEGSRVHACFAISATFKHAVPWLEEHVEEITKLVAVTEDALTAVKYEEQCIHYDEECKHLSRADFGPGIDPLSPPPVRRWFERMALEYPRGGVLCLVAVTGGRQEGFTSIGTQSYFKSPKETQATYLKRTKNATYHTNAGAARRLVMEFCPSGPASSVPDDPPVPGADTDRTIVMILACDNDRKSGLHAIYYTTRSMMIALDQRLQGARWSGCFHEGFELAGTGDHQLFVQQCVQSGFEYIMVLSGADRNTSIAAKDYSYVLTHGIVQLKDGGSPSTLLQAGCRASGCGTAALRETQVRTRLCNLLTCKEDADVLACELVFCKSRAMKLDKLTEPFSPKLLLDDDESVFSAKFKVLKECKRSHGREIDNRLKHMKIATDEYDGDVIQLPEQVPAGDVAGPSRPVDVVSKCPLCRLPGPHATCIALMEEVGTSSFLVRVQKPGKCLPTSAEQSLQTLRIVLAELGYLAPDGTIKHQLDVDAIQIAT